MSRAAILYINPFAQRISGPDESLLCLLQGLDKQRFKPVVWIPPASPFAEQYRVAGATVIEAAVPALRRSFSPGFWLGFLMQNRQAAQRLKQLIVDEQIQLVHANMEVLLFLGAARRAKVPVISHVRGTSFYHPTWIGRLLVGYIQRVATRIFCISDAVKTLFDDTANVVTLYNPINTTQFAPKYQPPTGVAAEWRGDKSLLVGTVGRLNARKDLESFVTAAAIVRRVRPDIGFVIVGGASGPEETAYLQRLQQQARQLNLGDGLRFAGDVRNMPEAYAAMDLCCLLSRSEGFGRVLAEAAAMGLPLIGTRIGGIQEIIQEGRTGVLVHPGRPQEAADAILQLAADPKKLRTMGARGRDRAEELFSSAGHVNRVEKYYLELLEMRN